MAVMDAGLTFRLRKRTIAGLLLLAAAIAMVVPLRGHSGGNSGGRAGELPVYMKAAERILHGEQIYRTDEVAAFTYPPFFVVPMLPLTPLSPLAQARVWYFVNLCLAGLILFVIARQIWPAIAGDNGASENVADPLRGRPGSAKESLLSRRESRLFPDDRGFPEESNSKHTSTRHRWMLSLLIAVLAGRFFISPLEYKSHDLIVLALVVLASAALADRCDAWAGLCLGLATACKATPLLFLPFLLWQRKYRATACFTCALVAATLLPDVLFPSADGRLWAVHWYDKFISKVQVDAPAQAAGAWSSWNMLNQGLAATIYRLTAPAEGGGAVNVCLVSLGEAARHWLTLAAELAVIGWLAWRTWPKLGHKSPTRERAGSPLSLTRGASIADPALRTLTQTGMVVSAMLLLSPMSSSQHFGALVVPISACSTYWLYRRRDPFLAAVLVLTFVFGTLAARDILGQHYAAWPQALGCKTWLALALLAACGRVLKLMEKESGTVFFTRITARTTSGEGNFGRLRPQTTPKTRSAAEIDLFPTPVP
jgi:hypothetical protein